MEKEETGKNETPKNNLIDLTIFFKSLYFLTNLTPEDDNSINNDTLLDQIIALKPEIQQILDRLLFERMNNPLVTMAFSLKQYGDIEKAKKQIKEDAEKNKKTIYRTVIYPKDLTPSPEDPLVSLQNDMNDFNRLMNELFLHNNAIKDPEKVFYLQMIVSAIINNLILFDTNPLLLLSEQAAYYINSNVLQAIIKHLSREEKYVSELQMLKNSNQLHDKILNIIINKDKVSLESLIAQSSEDVAITIDAILNMAIQYGAHFMAEFALEQWLLYFETHDLTEQSYRELVSLVGHALIRSNTQICLLLTQPEMWKLYREEDQLRLLELVMYRSGKNTKKILISNMKANGFLNLELCQRIPAKTEYQRKIINAILDEYYQEMLDNIKEILAENQKDKIELLISSFNSLPKEWQQKLTKKYGKIKFIVKNIESPGASKLLQSLEEQETAPKTKAKETKSSDQSLADEELIKLFGEKPKDKEPKNPKEPKNKSKKTKNPKEPGNKSTEQEDVTSKNSKTQHIKAPIEDPEDYGTWIEVGKKAEKSNPLATTKSKLLSKPENVKVEAPKKIAEKSKILPKPENVKVEAPKKIAEKSKILPKPENIKIPDKELAIQDKVTQELRVIVKVPQYTSTEAPKLINSEEEEKKEEPSEELTSFNSSTPTQKIEEESCRPLSIAHPHRYMEVINGLIVVIERCPITGKISQKFFDKDSGLEIVPTPGSSTESKAKETTAPTASTETNKAGETKADLAKLAADNNSQPSYSLTVKLVVEFNLSLSSSLIYEEVENTEQDEYKESIEQVEQRLEDQSANIQVENTTSLHNNFFIPSDKHESSLPFLIIGDPLEAGKVLGMVENLNYLENIAI